MNSNPAKPGNPTANLPSKPGNNRTVAAANLCLKIARRDERWLPTLEEQRELEDYFGFRVNDVYGPQKIAAASRIAQIERELANLNDPYGIKTSNLKDEHAQLIKRIYS
ncbi:MAG: hypothetical protein KGL39_38910 [Patescibacteria group bacterium]|nr:hypothetical protein [Patescibacteria group bacterium]